MTHYECMICGCREHVLREGQIFLCARCIEALGEALAEKLTKKEASPVARSFPDNFCRIP